MLLQGRRQKRVWPFPTILFSRIRCYVRMKRLFPFAIAVCGLLVSCQSSARFEPPPPEEKYNATSSSVPQLVSVINIPVAIPVAELERKINAQVAGLLYADSSLENNNRDELMLKVWKREAIRLETANGQFNLVVPLRIWAKKGINVLGTMNYQDTEFALDARFISRISVNAEYQVVTNTTANGFDWIEKPYLKLGFIEVPITGLVERIITQQQPDIARQMDAQLRQQLDLKPYIGQVWQLLRQPLLVSRAHDAWLRVTPLEIWMTPFTANGAMAQARIGIKARTETWLGQKAVAAGTPTVPPLRFSNQLADDFQLGLTGEIPHAAATRMAASELVGKSFEFQGGKRKITLTSVDLYGNNGNLVIKTGVTGSLDGTVYLVGKPFFNPENQMIQMRDLDFALDTKSRLAKTAGWLAHGNLAKRMQDNFRIPVGSQLETARAAIQAQLTNYPLAKGVTLNGRLNDFTPSEVIITSQSIIAVVTAKGKVDVKISGL